jgi:hypothetical protein
MSNLQDFHHSDSAPDKSSRLVTWAVIALIISGIGIYAIESGMFAPTPSHNAQNFPRGL